MRNIDGLSHVTGKSVYVDDLLEIDGTLYSVILTSPVAHGRIASISSDINHPDLVTILTAEDIPGENQIGGIIPDEELLASKELHYFGQPIAIVVARTLDSAYEIRDMISVEVEELNPVFDPREAYEKGKIIGSERQFELGDMVNAWRECDHIVEGKVEIGGQEHLYIETQGAYALPTENGYKVISSTQGPTSVQKIAARILGLPMHRVEVDVRRLGGGFGGKEDQATPIACMAILATHTTRRPVKLVLDRHDDLKITGKRHPYSADYKIGMRGNKIHAYDVRFFQNAGSAADLSPAVLERTLFHATNSYYIPNVRAWAVSCRTNLPPNTAFRGFGGPQGMIVIESAIDHIANELGVAPSKVQRDNLIGDGDEFPYGQCAAGVTLVKAWEQVEKDTVEVIREIKDYNATHTFSKKGYAFMPITFGISFTNTSMNQASALVNVYIDGSIGISTGAVEMGQGVNTRILQVVTNFFGLPERYGKVETTNTTRAINTSPSAASSTHDLNGKAALDACKKIRERLEAFLSERGFSDVRFTEGKAVSLDGKSMSWEELISAAYLARVDLAAHGFYSTPQIHFDKEREKGHPFAYHTYGVALITSTVDCLRGISRVENVFVCHDSGKLLNSNLDIGQIEGGVVQGLGWMLLEDLVFDDKGINRSGSLSTYKVPDIDFAPRTFVTKFLEVPANKLGLKGSKAIGEPPLMYAIAGYFSVRDAMNKFRTLRRGDYTIPMTNERIFMELYA